MEGVYRLHPLYIFHRKYPLATVKKFFVVGPAFPQKIVEQRPSWFPIIYNYIYHMNIFSLLKGKEYLYNCSRNLMAFNRLASLYTAKYEPVAWHMDVMH